MHVIAHVLHIILYTIVSWRWRRMIDWIIQYECTNRYKYRNRLMWLRNSCVYLHIYFNTIDVCLFVYWSQRKLISFRMAGWCRIQRIHFELTIFRTTTLLQHWFMYLLISIHCLNIRNHVTLVSPCCNLYYHSRWASWKTLGVGRCILLITLNVYLLLGRSYV